MVGWSALGICSLLHEATSNAEHLWTVLGLVLFLSIFLPVRWHLGLGTSTPWPTVSAQGAADRLAVRHAPMTAVALVCLAYGVESPAIESRSQRSRSTPARCDFLVSLKG